MKRYRTSPADVARRQCDPTVATNETSTTMKVSEFLGKVDMNCGSFDPPRLLEVSCDDVTIVYDDRLVICDGVGIVFTKDEWANVPVDEDFGPIHAIQYHNGEGDIEFKETNHRGSFTGLEEIQPFIDAWERKYDALVNRYTEIFTAASSGENIEIQARMTPVNIVF